MRAAGCFLLFAQACWAQTTLTHFPKDLDLKECKTGKSLNFWDLADGKAIVMMFVEGDCSWSQRQTRLMGKMIEDDELLRSNLQVIAVNDIIKKSVCKFDDIPFPIVQDELVTKTFSTSGDLFFAQKGQLVMYDMHGQLVCHLKKMEANIQEVTRAPHVKTMLMNLATDSPQKYCHSDDSVVLL
eukprot:GEMP01072791.1.p1 GENE.GEMP01072791.1~~GEMP01072791.1.p1  ORF type:complete len:184 (+),score=32.81 GEMP01072791.1:106-657(+)